MKRGLGLVAALALAGCSGPPAGTAWERGLAAFEAGDMRTARVEFLNAIEAAPGDRRVRIMQARVNLQLGDGIGAEAEIRRSRELGAAVGETAHLLAHARLLQGDPQGAAAEAAHAAPEHRAYGERIRGRALALLGDMAAAWEALERALAAAPGDSDIWFEIARFRRASGDVGDALQAADRALALRPRNAEALVLRGELTRGQYGLLAALPWFDRALEVEPNNVVALLERAVTYGDLGRASDMLADTRRVQALTGGHPTAYYLQAVLAARGRRFALAKEILAHTRGAFADTPAGILLEGAIELETGNAGQAALRLGELVRRQPNNRKARRLLAAAQWRAGDAAGVVATLRPIADRPDADAYSLSLIGRALAHRGDRAAAAAYLARAARPQPGAHSAIEALSEGDFARLRRAADERPGDGPTQVRFISALLARGLGAEALGRARRLQAANPGAPEVHMLVGDALGMTGDFAGAAEQYRRAANLAFSEPVAIRLVEALHRSGRADSADGVLRLYLRQNPRSVPALLLHGGRAMQAGDWPTAIAVYEGLRRRLGDNDATVLNNLAWAHAEQGDFDAALPLARRAWALDRDNPATADTLGWILFRSGTDRAAGLVLLEQAARGAPGDAEIRRRLERARRG